MKKHLTCIISGRVQGVLYRSFTRDSACKLGIKGEVKNLPDGTVLIEAEGEEEKLEEFKLKLHKGSAFSKVADVVCDFSENLLGYENFKIKYRNFIDRF